MHIYVQPHWSKAINLYILTDHTQHPLPISIQCQSCSIHHAGIFKCLCCSAIVSVFSFVHLNVKLNVLCVPVVDEMYFCFWFDFTGIVRSSWIVGSVHKVLSWVPDDIDIWSRCTKMMSSNFDVFMFFFYIPLHHNAKCPISKWSCQMAQRQRWDSLAAGLHVFLDIRAVSCSWLIWKAQMVCIILYFGKAYTQQGQ